MFSSVSVVIVSWNVRDKLEMCLDAVIQENPLEIFVIDNVSKDGSADMVRKKFPSVKLTVSAVNQGFAKACNEGIKQSTGEVVLLLNPDAVIKVGALKKAEDFFKSHIQVGAQGGRLLNSKLLTQPSVRRFPSLASQVLILTKISRLFPNLIRNYMWNDFDYQKAAPVEQVMGAFLFIRKDTINKIGLLDENFFIWFEEVDYCNRIIKANLEVWYNPSVEAVHLGGASFYQLSHLRRQLLFNKSLLTYFKKNHSFVSYLVLAILTPISIIESLIIDLLKNERKAI